MKPQADPRLLAAAIAAHRAGRLAAAEQSYRRLLTAEPGNFVALHLLGLLLGQLGRLSDGATLIRKALTIRPASPEALTDLGELLRRGGDLEAAARSFATALKVNSRHAPAHHNLGLARLGQGRLAEAAASFETVTHLTPESADAWHALGLARQGQEEYGAAIGAYRSALAISPARLDTLCALGGAAFDNGNTDGALTAYRGALARSPNHAPALRGLAWTLAERDPAGAIAAIRQALIQTPADGDLHEVLGSLLRRSGEFGAAFESFRTAIALPGKTSVAYYGLSLCRRFTAADDDLIAAMAAALNQASLDDRERSAIHFSLGKVFDDLERYDEAIVHFDHANRLWLAGRTAGGGRATPARLRSAQSALIDALVARFDAGEIARLRAWSDPSDRPIFIVGMMRSGTTLVEQILASHPDVAAGGELRFWSDLMPRLKVGEAVLERGAAEEATRAYLDVLSAVSPESPRVTDKMPRNFLAVGLIHALFPNARILHCRRHPVDTGLSIYFTQFVGDQAFAYDRGAIVAYYRDYVRLMTHWRRLLPADRFMDIDYERLVEDQAATSRDIIAFCGLAWDEACMAFQDTARPIHTASAWQARQPMYRSSTERWRHYEPWLGAFRELLGAGEA